MENPLETDDEKRRRVLAAIGGSFRTLPETPPMQMGGAVELPEQVITADPERIPGPGAISPPRMTQDEFPDPEPAPGEQGPGVPQPLTPRRELSAPMLSQLPDDAPGLARLGQLREQQPDATPAHESHGGFGGGMGWALVADALLNRGRGAGGILALGSSGATEDRNMEREYKRAQIEHLRREPAGQSPEMMAYRQAMLDLHKGDQGLRERNLNDVQNRAETNWKRSDDPASQHNMTAEEMAGRKRAAAEQSALDVQNTNVERTSENKAQIAGGETAARIGATHDLAPVTRDDAAAQAAAVAAAALPSRIAEKGAPGAAPARVGSAQLVPIPGFAVDVPESVGAIQGNSARFEKLQQGVAGAHSLDSALGDLEKIAQGGPQWKPGEQQSAYDIAYGRVIGGLTDLFHSGVLNEAEVTRYKGMIPQLGYGKSDAMDVLNSFTGKSPTNTRVEQLKGIREEMRKQGASKFSVMGGHLDFGDEQPSAAVAPQLGSPKRAGYQRDGLPAESLGVTGIGQGPQGLRGSTAATPEIPAEPPLSNDEAPSEVIANDDGTFDIAESGGQVHRGVKIGPAKLAWMRAHPDEWNVK
jgi:hypothetical protein